MAIQIKAMTSGEFAKAAGVSTAAISKLIRDGKLKANKEGGKWMIPQSQLDSEAVRALKGPAKPGKAASARGRQALKPAAASPPPAPGKPESRTEEKTYTIPEFAAMTYLTEKGVAEWLKTGRIKGIQAENGQWRVLERNLQVADISRLVRK
jgi:excisionase family DNA binding protein